MLGHCADSHTVCNPRPRASFLRLLKFSPPGALARSHSGVGCRTGGPTSIWTNWETPAICHSILHGSLAIREARLREPFYHRDTETQRTPTLLQKPRILSVPFEDGGLALCLCGEKS